MDILLANQLFRAENSELREQYFFANTGWDNVFPNSRYPSVGLHSKSYIDIFYA